MTPIFNNEKLNPDVEAAMLTEPADTQRIGEKEIHKAIEILQRYKGGKANLEARVVDDELWWELRHWEAVERTGKGKDHPRTDCKGRPIVRGADPTSAWLFNSIANKHADAMDNYPEPVVLPRERSDEESAKILSEVLPVIMEYNDFEDTYSDAWWEKLKHGTAVYGVFWNSEKENGLGDVDIRSIDLLNIFWEPGITDIQKSKNIFTVELVDNDTLEQQYPQLERKLGKSATVDIAQYLYDDTVNTTDKSVVVDWYYKVRAPGGRTALQYVKFVGDTLLYASENDPQYRDTGFYEHGRYPFVFDCLFPEKGTPVGFGYVAICKDPQLYIDKLSGNILDYSLKATHPRFFAATSTGVNEQEFMDWDKPIVHVEGQLDDTRLRQITLDTMPSIYTNILQMKIEEMKDTAANKDVNSGGTSHGVTAAAAIAALQEAGNKMSRDMIAASYRANSDIAELVIELIRQFYDETRTFRITGQRPGQYDFVDLNNAPLRDQQVLSMNGMPVRDMSGQPLVRRPVFDLKVSAQKKNPFSRMEQNERAKELYGLGFFNPERAQEALGALEMMDFEGIDDVREYVQQGQTLMSIVQQMSAQMQQMAGIIQTLTGQPTGAPGSENAAGGTQGAQNAQMVNPKGGADSLSRSTMEAHTPMTSYGDRLARRSTPNVMGE